MKNYALLHLQCLVALGITTLVTDAYVIVPRGTHEQILKPGDIRETLLNSNNSNESEASSGSTKSSQRTVEILCPDCDLCDGSGRIAGGIGAVIPWIPIKAYRPCPNFLDRGGFYQRSGQGLDELAFGRKPDE